MIKKDHSKLIEPCDPEVYDCRWVTKAMADGEQSISEHLAEEPHNVELAEIERLTSIERYKLHDQLHADAGDDEVMALVRALGLYGERTAL